LDGRPEGVQHARDKERHHHDVKKQVRPVLVEVRVVLHGAIVHQKNTPIAWWHNRGGVADGLDEGAV
jgi:hypothetical protein